MTKNRVFIKWAGGKKQLLSQFENYFPRKIERYFEPFVGGGAVAFHIIQKYNPKKVYLSDINEDLVNCYNVVKNNVEELIVLLKNYKNQHSKEFYYQMREKEPDYLNKIERAARFIYLNRTCFNGLYRVNSKGKFNVPMGSYKNPNICPESDLRYISKLLKNAVIETKQFYDAVKTVSEGDFVYFDPPYDPLPGSKSFTTYTKDNFLKEEQKKLSQVFDSLVSKKALVMLSNSDTDFIKDLYKAHNVSFVKATRMINSDASKRGKINEVVVTNYSPKIEQTNIFDK